MPTKRKALHQPPPEFAEAVEMRKAWRWREHQEKAASRAERDRERIMPAHPAANPARVLYYDKCGPCYEDKETTRERIWRRATRRANRIVHPLFHKIFG